MQTLTLPQTAPARGRSWLARLNWPRGIVVALTALAIFLPLLLIFYQSFLSAPFFMPRVVWKSCVRSTARSMSWRRYDALRSFDQSA